MSSEYQAKQWNIETGQPVVKSCWCYFFLNPSLSFFKKLFFKSIVDLGFYGGSEVKNLPANSEDTGDEGE